MADARQSFNVSIQGAAERAPSGVIAQIDVFHDGCLKAYLKFVTDGMGPREHECEPETPTIYFAERQFSDILRLMQAGMQVEIRCDGRHSSIKFLNCE